MSSQQQTNTSSPRSYVNAAKTVPVSTPPKREQAILLDAIEPFKLFDYVKAISAIVGAKNIIFASRIANNRICIYLSNLDTIDRLLSIHKTIMVGETHVAVRRLVTPSKRIIISNVSPSIPHELIGTYLRNYGLKLVSPVTYLRAGIPTEEFAHILSFRRQVYISPPEDDNIELPSTLIIPHEEINYRIFLSHDNMECFICKKTGHISNNCPNTAQSLPRLPHTQQEKTNNTDGPSQADISEINNINIDHTPHKDNTLTMEQPTMESTTQQETTKKRPLTPSTSTTESHSFEQDFETTNDDPTNAKSEVMPPPPTLQHISRKDSGTSKTPKPKRQRTSTSRERAQTDDTLSEIKTLFENDPSKYPLPYENFRTFIENCHGNNNPLTEAYRFTSEITTLLSTVVEIRQIIKNKSLKNRLTRLAKKLEKEIKQKGIEVESVASLSSQNSQEDETADVLSEPSAGFL